MGTDQRRPTEAAPASPLDREHRLLTVALVALVTIIAFEAMAVSTAMPLAAEDLDAVRSYGLAFSVMLTAQLLGIVVAGVWSDRAGPMPGLYVGQLLFALGAGVCGVSGSFDVLLVGRAVTGLGAGLVIVVLYVVVGHAYPAAIRPRVFSYVSAAWVLPALVGAPVSSWLATTFTWRLVFVVVIPPALVTLAVVAARRRDLVGDSPDVPAVTTALERARNATTARLGVVVALAAGALQLGTRERHGLLSWETAVAVVGVVGVAVATPRLLPRGTVRMARGVPSVVLSRFLLTAAFNGSITYVPLMVTQERGGSLALAGIALAVGSLGWTVGSWVQGLQTFAGRRWLLVAGGGLSLTVGCLGLVVVAATRLDPWFFAVALTLGGLGMGLATTTTTVLLLDLTEPEELGRASASLQLADVLGAVLGIAAASAVFAALHVAGGDTRTYLVIWGGLAVVAAFVVVSGSRTRRRPTAPSLG